MKKRKTEEVDGFTVWPLKGTGGGQYRLAREHKVKCYCEDVFETLTFPEGTTLSAAKGAADEAVQVMISNHVDAGWSVEKVPK